MPSLNSFSIINDEEIHISREEWHKFAMTTYREDYYMELTNATWTSTEGYLKNGKYGFLHRYIMKKWYGSDVVREMSEKGWIVDHMNNDGFDCRISNLEFLATRHNVAKGQTLDVEAKAMKYRIALNMFKDFSTGLYQITIFFNENVCLCGQSDNSPSLVNSLKLLYDCDYRIVINDAESILLNYELERCFPLDRLRCVDLKIEYAELVQLTKEEIGSPMVFRDGIGYIVPGNNIWVDSVHYEKGWLPQIDKSNR